MKNPAPALTDKPALEKVITCLEKNIPLETQGACDQKTVFEILIRAAAAGDSVENTCRTMRDVPCGANIHYHLEKYNKMNELENKINRAMQARLPPRIVNGKQSIAIDLNLIPYYGRPNPEEEPYIVKSQAKAGTCAFYAYATVYVIRKNKRVTVAIIAVRHDETSVSIITRLLDKISCLNLRITCLYIDRGFFSVPVIRWLKALDIPFVTPVIIRGKNGGTRRLLRGGRSYKTVYTMHSQKYGIVTFDVWIVCVYSKGRYGKHGIEYLAYAVFRPPISLKGIQKAYRKRFGIETSYRLKNQCRIRTTSKNPAARFLFMGIAYIIKDIWVWLIWTYVSCPRKGGRMLFHNLFPLKLMLTFLRQAADRKHRIADSVYLQPIERT